MLGSNNSKVLRGVYPEFNEGLRTTMKTLTAARMSLLDKLYVITNTISMRTWNRDIRVYKTADGLEPFTKWMASLKNEKVRRAVLNAD